VHRAAFAPELVEEAVGGVGGSDGGLRPATQLVARLLTSALASAASDRLETEDAALLLLDAPRP
jgi:hypothetical protein